MAGITPKLVRSIADSMGLVHADAKFALNYLHYYYEPNKKKVLSKKDIETHTKKFQKSFGLTANGKLDGRTRRAMLTPRCGCPDFMLVTKEKPNSKGGPDFMLASTPEKASNANKWGIMNLTYYVEKYVRSAIPKSDMDDLIDLAFQQWEVHCGLDIRRTTSKSSANFIISTGQGRADNFDGPSGTLAWAFLPPNPNFRGQLLTRFDLDETWVADSRNRGTLFLNVACHEFGHLLGLDHSRQNRALMAPFYSPGVPKPVYTDDVTRIQRLYGPPKANPTPPPVDPKPLPPVKPGGHQVVINDITNLSQVTLNGKGIQDFDLL